MTTVSKAHKRKAHVAARKLPRPASCSDCGAVGKVHGHHEDYDKPLDVVWLCPKCHVAAHRGYPNVVFLPPHEPIVHPETNDPDGRVAKLVLDSLVDGGWI